MIPKFHRVLNLKITKGVWTVTWLLVASFGMDTYGEDVDLAELAISEEVLELTVRPSKKSDAPFDQLYRVQMLRLVLQKTEARYGQFIIREYKRPITQSRVIRQILKKDSFRVIATMTSERREQQLRPILIPLYKGVLDIIFAIVSIFIISSSIQAEGKGE